MRVIVITGAADIDGELESPPNVEILSRFPHAETLPRADLVIGHGGHSTTLRTLAHGVPILILPLDSTSDQSMVGEAIEAAGVGHTVSRDASSEKIREIVCSMLTDHEIAAAAASMGQRLANPEPPSGPTESRS